MLSCLCGFLPRAGHPGATTSRATTSLGVGATTPGLGPGSFTFPRKTSLAEGHGSRSQSARWGPGPVVHLQEGGVSGSARPQALQSPLHPLPLMPLVPAHLGRGHI